MSKKLHVTAVCTRLRVIQLNTIGQFVAVVYRCVSIKYIHVVCSPHILIYCCSVSPIEIVAVSSPAKFTAEAILSSFTGPAGST